MVVTAKTLRKDGQAWRQRPLVAGQGRTRGSSYDTAHEYARPALADLRKDYKLASLGKRDLAADPIVQFNKWMDEAIKAELPEPTAMNLATVSAQGRPSARIVLLKGCDERGFVFYSNYESRKGPRAGRIAVGGADLHWGAGAAGAYRRACRKVPDAESDAYFPQVAPAGLTHRRARIAAE